MKYVLLVLFLFFVHVIAYAQMPDWAMMIDKEGNKYYFDKNGNIYTDENVPAYTPVSKDGLEYYTSKVKTLWKAGHRTQSLVIAKSILALKESSMNVVKAKKDMSAFMRDMQAKHGKRFVDISKDAWLYITKEDNSMYVFNDKIPYIITVNGDVEIIAAKSVEWLQYSSTAMRAGVRFSNTSAYDAIMTVVAESFPAPLESINVLQQHWKNLAFDTFIRTTNIANEKMVLSSFSTDGAISLRGMELITLRENRGYLIRIFTTKEKYDYFKERIESILTTFSIP